MKTRLALETIMKQQKLMVEIFERQRDGVVLLKKSDKIQDDGV